jgi:restriction endonuclease S subunit
LEIPLPELEIQNKIVDALEKLTQLKANQIALNKKLEFLTPAILENVFQFNNVEILE